MGSGGYVIEPARLERSVRRQVGSDQKTDGRIGIGLLSYIARSFRATFASIAQ
jgi:hypothetical protein